MNVLARIGLILLMIGIAGFSVFGFLATFEPHSGSWVAWQVLYAATGLIALFAATRSLQRIFTKR